MSLNVGKFSKTNILFAQNIMISCIQRSKTIQYLISDKHLILETAKKLLFQEKPKNSVRLLGISLGNLNNVAKKESEKIQKSVSVQLKFEF